MRIAPAICIAIVTAICFPLPALAQNERFPPRIAVRELEMYRDWMNLSRAQWHAAAIAYLDYIRDYETLRPEIEQQSGVYANADTNAEMLERRRMIRHDDDAINRKIADADEQFFIVIHDMLPDEQLPGWQRMRDHRTRRSIGGYGVRSSAGRIYLDISQFLQRVDIDEDERAALEPMLLEYERKLTAAVQRCAREYDAAWLKAMEEMVRQGINDPNDPNRAYGKIWRAVSKDANAAAHRVLELTDDAARRVEAALSFESREKWRRAYLPIYYESASALWLRRTGMKAAVERLKLDAAQQDVATERFAKLDARFEEMLATVRAAEDAAFLAWAGDSDELLTARNAARDVRGQQETALDEEFAALKRDLSALLTDDSIPVELEGARQAAQNELTNPLGYPTRSRPTTLLGLQLDRDDLARMCDALALIGEEREHVLAAYAEYGRKVAELAGAIKPPERRVSWAPPEALDGIARLDAELFTALESQVDPAHQRLAKALRTLRTREVVHSQMLIHTWPADVDLADLLLELDAALLNSAAVLAELEAYEREARPIFDEWIAWQMQYRPGEPVRPPADARDKLIDVNLRFLDRLLLALDGEAAGRLRELFDQTCYREVLHDSQAAHGFLRRTLAREDLMEEQRAQLIQIIADYEGEYAQATRAMIDLVAKVQGWLMLDGELRPAGNDVGTWEYVPARARRDELSALARLRVEALLTPEQLERGF